VLPRWDGVLLLASALVLGFTNEEDARILLAVPFALAWLVTGVVMLRVVSVGPEPLHAQGPGRRQAVQ
jgi:hypothetical protein